MKAKIITLIILSQLILLSAFEPQPKAKKQIKKKEVTVDSVLICSTGRKYHIIVCDGLNECKSVIKKTTTNKAIEQGYTACKICY